MERWSSQWWKCSHFVLILFTLYSIFPKRNGLWFFLKKIQIIDKEDAIFVLKESFSFLPARPITHWVREHSLQESHRLNSRSQPSFTAEYLWTVRDRYQPSLSTELSPLACPEHRGASRGVLRLTLPPFAFSLIVLNTTYWASTLCLSFTLIVPLPPQALQRLQLNKVRLREHYQSGIFFFQTENPTQNGLSKKGYWLT